MLWRWQTSEGCNSLINNLYLRIIWVQNIWIWMIRSCHPKSFSILQSIVNIDFLKFVQFWFSSSLYTAPRCPWGISSIQVLWDPAYCIDTFFVSEAALCIDTVRLYQKHSLHLQTFRMNRKIWTNVSGCFCASCYIWYILFSFDPSELQNMKLGFWKPLLKAVAHRGLDHLFSGA